MRAARYHERRDARIDDVPEPHAGPGEVIVAVAEQHHRTEGWIEDVGKVNKILVDVGAVA